jgi:DNA excision repair protein ERCC-4
MSSQPDNPQLPPVEIPPGSIPTILIDTREQDRLPIDYPCEMATLPTGDYSYRGGEDTFTIERKSIPDLVGCLGADRERFQAQLQRLKGYSFARLLIVGNYGDLASGNYRSRLCPKAAVNSMRALEARFVPVVWCDTQSQAARQVEQWAFWHYRELIKALRRANHA